MFLFNQSRVHMAWTGQLFHYGKERCRSSL